MAIDPDRRSRWKLAGRVLSSLVALSALLGLGVWLINLTSDSSRQIVEAKYQAIQPGMNRTRVRGLVQGTGVVMYTGIGTAELMHVDGRYMIAVVYQPNPNASSPAIDTGGVPGDDWVVKEKLFLELGRGSTVDNALVGLGLRSARSIDRVRMPR